MGMATGPPTIREQLDYRDREISRLTAERDEAREDARRLADEALAQWLLSGETVGDVGDLINKYRLPPGKWKKP